jgi:hypothetical protein
MMMDIIHVHVRLPVVRTSFRFQPTGPLLLHFSPTQSISTFRPKRKRFRSRVCIFINIISLSNSDDNNNNQPWTTGQGRRGGHIESATAGHFVFCCYCCMALFIFRSYLFIYLFFFFFFSFSSWTGNE